MLLVLKVGRTRPSLEPRHGPQAGKSGDPSSQDTDSSPRAQGVALLEGLCSPSSSTRHSRPSRGAKPREADDTRPSQGRPGQAGSRGTERGSSRGFCDATHGDWSQAGASTRSVLVSSLVLKGQAQARSPGASGKGFHIGATRPRPPGRQDGGHRGAHCSVTTRVFCRRRLLLS